MNIRASPSQYGLGLLGWPIHQSFSPAIANAALSAMGLAGHYHLLELPPHCQTELPCLLRNLAKDGIHGINVTVPYKQAIVPHLDGLGPSARPIETVNTVCVQPDGTLTGHNTDIEGFSRSLDEVGVPPPRAAVVLGAGGAAAAVAFALLREGCGELIVINRTQARAQCLQQSCQELFPHASVLAYPTDADGAKRSIHTFPLIVNCTPDASVFPCRFQPGQVVCDIAAMRHSTPMLQQAHADGAQTLDGLGMLLHQAALSLALWTDREPPLEVMRKTLASRHSAHLKTRKHGGLMASTNLKQTHLPPIRL